MIPPAHGPSRLTKNSFAAADVAADVVAAAVVAAAAVVIVAVVADVDT